MPAAKKKAPAKKAPAKKAPAKKATAAKAGGGRKQRYADEAKITVLVKENPKREGSKSYDRFAQYMKASVKNVRQALDAGVLRADLSYDVDKGYIKIT